MRSWLLLNFTVEGRPRSIPTARALEALLRSLRLNLPSSNWYPVSPDRSHIPKRARIMTQTNWAPKNPGPFTPMDSNVAASICKPMGDKGA